MNNGLYQVPIEEMYDNPELWFDKRPSADEYKDWLLKGKIEEIIDVYETHVSIFKKFVVRINDIDLKIKRDALQARVECPDIFEQRKKFSDWSIKYLRLIKIAEQYIEEHRIDYKINYDIPAFVKCIYESEFGKEYKDPIPGVKKEDDKNDKSQGNDLGKPNNKGGRPKGIKSQKITKRNEGIRKNENYWRKQGLRGITLYTQLKSELMKKGDELAITTIRDICKYRNE